MIKKYNCEYEELLAIAMMNNLTFEEKIKLAQDGITFSQAEKMLGNMVKKWDRELEWCNEDDEEEVYRGHIFYGEEDYPESLANLTNPPFSLAWKGSKPTGCSGNFQKAQSLTIVGTRQADMEGRRSAYLLALEAAKNGIIVYSGYASGIDQSSHLGASDGNMKNFAIMPCGLKHSYAYRERNLAKKIYSSGGGFVSQFLCEEEPQKWNFHYRNRILAQISDATVIVQAPRSSGALITVKDALDAGKDVFVHQAGSGNKTNQEGTQDLINDGAISINSLKELSTYTFNAFECKKILKELPLASLRELLKELPDNESIYRYEDKYYRFVEYPTSL